MMNQKCSGMSLVLFCTFVLGAVSASEPDPNDPNWARVHEARVEFERRYSVWVEYIHESGTVSSSLAEDYMKNDSFHRLLELGPVAVPWYVEAEPSPFMNAAVQLVLRADWAELAGYSEEQRKYEDMYVALKKWWKSDALTTSSMMPTRMAKFRAWLKEQAKPVGLAEVRMSSQWRELRQVGLLGVPFILQRIRSGMADEHDYRLLCYWTDPIEYAGEGFPKLPVEKEEISEAKTNHDYWINWWRENRWQFWWLELSQ